MRRSSPNPGSRSAAVRTVAALSLFLFAFQLSRFFIVAQLDPTLCPWAFDERGAAQLSEGHHHHDESTLTIPPEKDSGFYLQHCKDTFEGLSLIPFQVLDLPAETGQLALSAARADFSSADVLFAEHLLPPPVQPPRA